VSYLIDSNVLCEPTRPRPERSVIQWLEEHDSELHVSVLTLGEIDKGIYLLPSSRRKERLRNWFAELAGGFVERILPIDLRTSSQWARLYARHQLTGRLYPAFDSLLAATALVNALTLVTRNTADFPPEVPMFNPWKE
jgi:predicted nucleic acid-binding protein